MIRESELARVIEDGGKSPAPFRSERTEETKNGRHERKSRASAPRSTAS